MHACPCHRCLLLLRERLGSLKSRLFFHHCTHVHRVLRNVGTTYFWVPLLLGGLALFFHGMSWMCTSLVTLAFIARGHGDRVGCSWLAAREGVARGGGRSPRVHPRLPSWTLLLCNPPWKQGVPWVRKWGGRPNTWWSVRVISDAGDQWELPLWQGCPRLAVT